MLILDEPTNHLDVDSVEALAKALHAFPVRATGIEFSAPQSKACVRQGGVVLVSHDERLIELVCTELWVVERGTVRRLEGGIQEYRREALAQLQQALAVAT